MARHVYRIDMSQTIAGSVYVVAENEDEARDRAYNRYDTSDWDADDTDIDNTEEADTAGTIRDWISYSGEDISAEELTEMIECVERDRSQRNREQTREEPTRPDKDYFLVNE